MHHRQARFEKCLFVEMHDNFYRLFLVSSINLVRYFCLVPNQCILYKTITNKGVMSIATKVAIQMNCKVGGAPWAVEIPLKVRIIDIICVK